MLLLQMLLLLLQAVLPLKLLLQMPLQTVRPLKLMLLLLRQASLRWKGLPVAKLSLTFSCLMSLRSNGPPVA